MRHLFLLLLIASGILAGCSSTPVHTASSKSHHNKKGMSCIAPNVYVDSSMSMQQRQVFLQTVQQSRTEIARFFGKVLSSPDIFACASKACFRRFGGIPARAKAIGDKKVILSERGLDKVTLTHELAHVELHKRLGSPHVWNKIPMWFDEGLAVMVCKDPRYYKEVQPMPLKKLVSQDQWVNAIRHNQPAYSVSRQAVETWYKGVGTQGLREMIRRMKQGKAFSLQSSGQAKLAVSRL